MMRVCTPVRSSLSLTWLKPVAASPYGVRSLIFSHFSHLLKLVLCRQAAGVILLLLLLSSSDRPDPPLLLQITDPKRRAVTLSWSPGDDHNSAVLGLVQTHILTLRRIHICTHLSP